MTVESPRTKPLARQWRLLRVVSGDDRSELQVLPGPRRRPIGRRWQSLLRLAVKGASGALSGQQVQNIKFHGKMESVIQSSGKRRLGQEGCLSQGCSLCFCVCFQPRYRRHKNAPPSNSPPSNLVNEICNKARDTTHDSDATTCCERTRKQEPDHHHRNQS